MTTPCDGIGALPKVERTIVFTSAGTLSGSKFLKSAIAMYFPFAPCRRESPLLLLRISYLLSDIRDVDASSLVSCLEKNSL
jgi:hypothetical protein